MKKLVLLFGMIVIMTSFSSAQDDETWIDLDGIDDYLDLGTDSILAGQTKFTVDMRIHVNDRFESYTIIGQRDSDANRTFVIQRWAGLLYILFDDYNYGTCTFEPCPSEYYRLIAVYDGSGANNNERLKFYVNGVLQSLTFEGTIPDTTHVTSPLATLVLGCEHNGAESTDHFMNGQFAEFCVWDYPLSQTEVSTRMVTEVTGNEAGLVEYFHFDNGIVNDDNTGIASFAGGKGVSNITLKNMTMSGTSSNFTGFPVQDNPVDPTLTVNGDVITANAEGATYQWLNCDDFYAIIPGATSKSFTATESGNYSVQITQGPCTITSECIQLSSVGIGSSQPERLSLYPNPVTNELIIENTGKKETLMFEILNSSGQLIFSDHFVEKTYVHTSEYASGIYFIKINTGDAFEVRKFVKE